MYQAQIRHRLSVTVELNEVVTLLERQKYFAHVASCGVSCLGAFAKYWDIQKDKGLFPYRTGKAIIEPRRFNAKDIGRYLRVRSPPQKLRTEWPESVPLPEYLLNLLPFKQDCSLVPWAYFSPNGHQPVRTPMASALSLESNVSAECLRNPLVATPSILYPQPPRAIQKAVRNPPLANSPLNMQFANPPMSYGTDMTANMGFDVTSVPVQSAEPYPFDILPQSEPSGVNVALNGFNLDTFDASTTWPNLQDNTASAHLATAFPGRGDLTPLNFDSSRALCPTDWNVIFDAKIEAGTKKKHGTGKLLGELSPSQSPSTVPDDGDGDDCNDDGSVDVVEAIEAIVGHRPRSVSPRKAAYFRVRWKGESSADWVGRSHIPDELLVSYYKEYLRSKQMKRLERRQGEKNAL
ncbi:hypothetical protein F5Y15DRAFT_377670, partial [Xylariaceae sp. FL0016]